MSGQPRMLLAREGPGVDESGGPDRIGGEDMRRKGEQNDRHDGIRGHCAGGVADADVCGGAEGGGAISGDLVLLGYFSTDAADAADLRAAGGVWICGGGAGDLQAD